MYGETPFAPTRPSMRRLQRSPRLSELKIPARPVVVRTFSPLKRNGTAPSQHRTPSSGPASFALPAEAGVESANARTTANVAEIDALSVMDPPFRAAFLT